MYNYSMPSVFKAWLGHIMIVGRTFGTGDTAPLCAPRRPRLRPRGGGYGPGKPATRQGLRSSRPGDHPRRHTGPRRTRRSCSRCGTWSRSTRPRRPRPTTWPAADLSPVA
ncbi:hypothetical protein AB0942_32905 [Streptomyces nodosus]|uniref:hypothetical protein n=1 Tax=Streptomyces nodosus TaxID=40318 RepID=UPI00345714E5